MMIALWILTLGLLGLWSLSAWGVHALLTLDASRLGDLKLLVDQIPYGDVIGAWIPGWQDLLRMTIDFTQVALGWVGGAAPVVVWIVWTIGALTILGIGALLSGLIVMIRRSAAPSRAAA
ncbi:MAG: hypothetical protein MUC74_09135 [Ideonella sp.]|jgi:hypothetical protein|nr:hypothetical protein [Ideonella sp.]